MDTVIYKAKIALMLENPFWGHLVVKLMLREWDGKDFATNGKTIFVPKDFRHLSSSQLLGRIANLTMHCALGHLFRQQGKNPQKWAMAADFAANLILYNAGFNVKDGLLDKAFAGKSAEQIYNELPDMPAIPDFVSDMLKPGEGEPQEENGEPIDANEMEQDWKETILKAVSMGRGSLPNGIEEYIKDLLISVVPWQSVLSKNLIEGKGCSDFTSYPFDRRHLHREIYLPSLRGESLRAICVIDTSGSISIKQATTYLSEVIGLCSSFGEYTIYMIMADAGVHGEIVEITSESDVPRLVVGRGGTDFSPAFEMIENNDEINGLPVIYFTDLDGCFPKHEYDGNTYWLVKTEQLHNQTVPFGTIIEIQD